MAKSKKAFHYLIAIGIVVTFTGTLGCQSTPPPGGPCPKWVRSIPTDDTYYYAVGVSGPRPHTSEMFDQAIERARAELGRMIVSHVKSEDFHSSSTRGQYAKEIVRVLSDTELNYTEVIKRHLDPAGACGSPNHCYALVRIKKSTAQAIGRSFK
jgi:hypothetical protein